MTPQTVHVNLLLSYQMHGIWVPSTECSRREHVEKETAKSIFLILRERWAHLKDELLETQVRSKIHYINCMKVWLGICREPGFLNKHTKPHLTHHLSPGGEGVEKKCFASRHEHVIHRSMEISTPRQNCNWQLKCSIKILNKKVPEISKYLFFCVHLTCIYE